MHGGAKGSGAPTGSQNALKHGLSTKEVKELRRAVKSCLNNFHLDLSKIEQKIKKIK